MDKLQCIGVVGAGLIGSGWISRCSARGIQVIACDSAPNGEDAMHMHLDNAWPALEKLGFCRSEAPTVQFTSDLERLAREADFIQESIPEVLELKTQMHADIDRYAASEVIIASSSSGLLPSQFQSQAQHPQRIVVGHPFNPVYILPLVEIVKGRLTSDAAACKAADFYRSIGMHPLMVRKEVPGYVSDRLQEALWRETLHMIADGVATTEDIDDAIVYGPGLRWAIMGVCLTFHLAGGEQGMRHMLKQFGPALELPWTHMQAPPLTAELVDRMVDGTQRQAGSRSIRALEQLRDECLIDILDVLHKHDCSAGTSAYRRKDSVE